MLSLVFHSSFKECFPLCSSHPFRSVRYRVIEFFVFDHDSLPYLLFVFLVEVTFPLVALDKISSCSCVDLST